MNKNQERRVLIPQDIPPSAFRGAGSGLAVCHLTGTTMGTHWHAWALLPPHLSEEILRQTITGTFQIIIDQMSHWDPTSELSRFNNATPDTWHTLSPEFFTVLSRALEISEITQGAFDPTIGKIVDLHGFGPTEPTSHLPTKAELSHAATHSGWQNIRLNPESRSAYQPGAHSIDLSSIAKGFAVDLAAEALNEIGITSYLLEIGGEFRGQGCKNDAKPWWVTLAPSAPDSPLPETIVALCGLSIATSGNTIRRRIINNTEISHLIDPHTTLPTNHELVSVSVLAPTCMEADAWATALFISGPQNAKQLARNHNLAALFTTRIHDHLHESWSPAFQKLLS